MDHPAMLRWLIYSGGGPQVNMAVTMQGGVDARSKSMELHGYRPVNRSNGP